MYGYNYAQFENKVGSASLLGSSVAHNRLKNLTTAVIATRRATRILLRGVNQKLNKKFCAKTKKFFCTKTAWFSPPCWTNWCNSSVSQTGIVNKYLVTGDGAPSQWAIFAIIQQKNRDLNAILITFCTFWSIGITKFPRSRIHFKELNGLAPSAPSNPSLQVKYKMHLNARILRLIFLSD